MSAPGRPRRLTREAVVAAALVRLDRDGPDRLSMRSLASELGVGTMTLYGYFATKDELLDAVVEHVAETAEVPDPDGPWDERLRILAGHLHRSLLAHPGLVALRATRPIATPGAFRLTERCMAALHDAGLDRAEAARAFRSLFVFTFGAAAFAVRRGSSDASHVAEVLGGLPPEEFPHLRAGAREALAAMEPQTSFEAGLELLLAGIAARAA